MGPYDLRPMRAGEWEAVLDCLDAAFDERDVFERFHENDPDLRDEDTLVAFHEKHPVACVQIFTKKIRLRGETVGLGGIGSVGTHPDHRHRRLASELLRLAIAEMSRRGMALSLLFTGRLTFYEPLGWISIPGAQLAFHAGNDAASRPTRPFEASDLEQMEPLYERYSTGFEANTLRDTRYWIGQLAYAGNPDERIRVAERDRRIVAYARGVQVSGISLVQEYARTDDAAADLADLIVELAPEEGPLILPWGEDVELRAELEPRARRLDAISDSSSMWRVLDRPLLAKLAELPSDTTDSALLHALVGAPGTLYWPSDRF